MRNDVRSLVSRARNDIDHGYRLDRQAGPEQYVGEVIHLIESGDLPEVADDWARQQSEYVYTTSHFDMEADYRYTDEWQEAERGATRSVVSRRPMAGYLTTEMLLDLVKEMRAETVARLLADAYTTAMWDWLHLAAFSSPTARDYLDEQAELALAGARDVPHLD